MDIIDLFAGPGGWDEGHLVARLDAAATEIRNQADTPEGNP